MKINLKMVHLWKLPPACAASGRKTRLCTTTAVRQSPTADSRHWAIPDMDLACNALQPANWQHEKTRPHAIIELWIQNRVHQLSLALKEPWYCPGNL
jgi:hypothetical protein